MRQVGVVIMDGPHAKVDALTVTPDGTLLVSGRRDGSVQPRSLPGGEQVSCLMDVTASEQEAKGIEFKLGESPYTLPCGVALPAGAVCTCNCVAGAPRSCVGYCAGGDDGGSHYWHPN